MKIEQFISLLPSALGVLSVLFAGLKTKEQKKSKKESGKTQSY